MEASAALIIIDLFSLFDFPGGQRLAALAVHAAERAAALRDAFDKRGLPVIHANDNFGDWKRDFPALVDACRDHGGASARIASIMAPQSHHYFILKPKHSAFLATPLPVLLASLGASRVVLAGMALDSCVLATALDANSREYETVVAWEATAALPGRREPALQVLKRSAAAKVLDNRQIIALLDAGLHRPSP
ncbi:isochorismatase family cysteine hydrolase [Stenotrophomonas sp. ZAC14A_NAIMI4_1]|uniref:cysteine hydrolase family protein n=1 Tax=Stenotrophomonas sp. ZAC14A_NAIMI4_1 TaxID=2072412 RepID=UPI000D5427F8|nr:isochorismatase family cysteine hydrolase [Stenotrophomonas sp. ZAC14A_NAIMI4_1]AWH46430.1 cysteine hydrolase [Stenotrophomonas sp. ZAC14A_NAIMI4_1]